MSDLIDQTDAPAANDRICIGFARPLPIAEKPAGWTQRLLELWQSKEHPKPVEADEH